MCEKDGAITNTGDDTERLSKGADDGSAVQGRVG